MRWQGSRWRIQNCSLLGSKTSKGLLWGEWPSESPDEEIGYLKTIQCAATGWFMVLHLMSGYFFWIVVPAYYELFIHPVIFIECLRNSVHLVTWHLFFCPSWRGVLLCCSPEGFFTFSSERFFFDLLGVVPDPMWGQRSGMSYVYRL